MATDTKTLTISISQIAPLIGLDHYNNFAKNVCEIWRRYKPEEFREFELKLKDAGNNKLANANEMNDIWEMDKLLGTNLIDRIKTINDNKNKSSNDMVKMQQELTTYIQQQTTINNQDKIDITKKICSVTNKNHGINNEDEIINQFCKLSTMTIKDNQGWVNIPLLDSNYSSIGITWKLIGKYDGITTDNELVEAKMRQNGLFKKMRDYENIQVQLYLHGLGYRKGYLVEGYKNKKNELQILTHEIDYDDYYVKEVILDRLVKFTKFFDKLMLNEDMKNELLKGDNNKTVKKHYEMDYLDIGEIEF
jgi:hypothetical protein